MIREFSAGILPFHEDREGRKYLLLLSNLSRNEFWEFPKGLIEAGEDAQTAALREFTEESGIQKCELIPGFKKVLKYFYRRREELIAKTVTYFLGRTSTRRVTISHESKDFAWDTLAEAQKRIKHKNIRDLLMEAEAFLKEQERRK